MTRLGRGWHNIIITCDNLGLGGKGELFFYIDGHKTAEKGKHILCCQPIGYIGNSKNGENPFGAVSDLRIFPKVVSCEKILDLSEGHE